MGKIRSKQRQPSTWKNSVRVASTQHINLSSTSFNGSIDTISLNDGDRVLLKNQNDPKNNGIYRAKVATDPSSWERSKDMNSNVEVMSGIVIPVEEGDSNGNQAFLLVTSDTISIGSTALQFEIFGATTGGRTLRYGGDIPVSEFQTIDFVQQFDGGTDFGRAQGLHWRPDGTGLFVIDNNANIYRYSASTAWDISTLTLQNSVTRSEPSGGTQELTFRSDGKKMYIIGGGANDNTLYQYDLGTAWDLSTLSFTGSFDTSSQTSSPRSLDFKTDGNKLYLTASGEITYEYGLTTSWDITTASLIDSFDHSSFTSEADGLEVTEDGEQLYISNSQTPYVVSIFQLTDPWDITSAEFINSLDISDHVARLSTVTLGKNQTKLYTSDDENPTIQEFDLNNSLVVLWNFENRTFINSGSVSGSISDPHGVDFKKDDGSKMYVTDSGGPIAEYDLTDRWNVNSLTHIQTESFARPLGIFFKPDGTKFWTADFSSDVINEYVLSTNWDISTASLNQSASLSAQPRELYFTNDGKKIFIDNSVPGGGGSIERYDLSTAWDIGSASFVQSISSAVSESGGINFDTDGKRLFKGGGATSGKFAIYFLSTPFDLSTAFLDRTLTLANNDNLEGSRVKPDGSRIYLSDQDNQQVDSYALGRPYIRSNEVSGQVSDFFDLMGNKQPIHKKGELSKLSVLHERDYSITNGVMEIRVNGTVQDTQTLTGEAGSVDIINNLGISVNQGDKISLRMRENGGKISAKLSAK